MIRKLILLILLLSSLCFAGSIQDMHKSAIARKNTAVADGVLGNTTHDVSKSVFTNDIYHDKWQATTPGVVNYIHVYMSGGNGDTVCLSIFAADGAELASCSGDPGTDVAGWYNCQLDSEITLVAATNYYLGYFSTQTGADNFLYQKDAGDGGFHDQNVAFTCGDAVVEEEAVWYGTDDIALIVNNISGDPS